MLYMLLGHFMVKSIYKLLLIGKNSKFPEYFGRNKYNYWYLFDKIVYTISDLITGAVFNGIKSFYELL
ncbi:hypothetical protein BKC07_16855 [Peribacillus simplex]|nr:hypothetical protein BKC07_16855 [Peribacillus simplex]